MPPMSNAPDASLDPAQAAELAVLVDVEARWENLRQARRPGPPAGPVAQDLQARQKAYDAFRGRLVAYNRRYAPAHVPELLLNTPSRLAAWCRRMRDLYLLVEHAPRGHCPLHLLEKARRWAERVGARHDRPCGGPATPPATVAAAVQELEALARWCDELSAVASADPARV